MTGPGRTARRAEHQSSGVPSSRGAVDSHGPRTPEGGEPSPEHPPSPQPTNSWPQPRASCPWVPASWQSASRLSSPSSLSPLPYVPHPCVPHSALSVDCGRDPRPAAAGGGGGGVAETLGEGEGPTLRALSGGPAREARPRAPARPPRRLFAPSAAPSERTGPSDGAAESPPRPSSVRPPRFRAGRQASGNQPREPQKDSCGLG